MGNRSIDPKRVTLYCLAVWFVTACSPVSQAVYPIATPTAVEPPTGIAGPLPTSTSPITALPPVDTAVPAGVVTTRLFTPLSPTLPVTNIAVTPDGAIWYSYGDLSFRPPESGLVRYHQGDYIHFTMAEGLPGDNVHYLEVAPDGSLWVGAGCRVGRYDNQSWTTLSDNCDHLGGNVLDFAFTPDGAAWVATGFSLARYQRGTWTLFDKLANSLAVGADGRLWVFGWHGLQGSQYLHIFGENRWEIVPLPPEVYGRLIDGPDGRVWGATSSYGIARVVNRGWEILADSSQPLFRSMGNHTVGPDGTLWTITDQGLAAFNGRKWQVHSQAPTTARTIFAANDGSVWIGTYEGLVWQYRPRDID